MADPYGTAATDDPRYLEQRWGDITRRVMREINVGGGGGTPLSEVPTLFAFGPISRELERAFIAGQASEREACAQLATHEALFFGGGSGYRACSRLSTAIRARGASSSPEGER